MEASASFGHAIGTESSAVSSTTAEGCTEGGMTIVDCFELHEFLPGIDCSVLGDRYPLMARTSKTLGKCS